VLEIAGSAHAAVENFLDACLATLPDDLCGKIDLVVRWPNTGTQLHNKITRLNSKTLPHRFDRAPNDSQCRALFPGMNQTNRTGIPVDQVNRAAISYVNSKADIALIGDQPIATFETAISGRNRIDSCDLVSVNLAHGNEFSITQAKSLPRLPMHLVEVFQDNRFVMRQLDSRNAFDESVKTTDPVERGKCFDR